MARRRLLFDPQAIHGPCRTSGPFLADSRLSHCNEVVQCSESAQKAADGKKRPQAVLRQLAARMAGLRDIADELLRF